MLLEYSGPKINKIKAENLPNNNFEQNREQKI